MIWVRQTPENIPLRQPDLTMVLTISYHLWTVMVREIEYLFNLVFIIFLTDVIA